MSTLDGRTIGITADRRWQEQAKLFEARGATVLHGPTMRTVDLTADPALRAATEAIVAAPPDVLVCSTGMGVKWWAEAAEAWGLRAPLLTAFAASTVVCRGAKSSSVARGLGLEVSWRAPNETMAEVVDHVNGLAPTRLAVQEYDPDETFPWTAPDIVEVPVYRWLLPEDPAPAAALVDAALAGELSAVTFTSQPAAHHLFRLAGDRAAALRAAFAGPLLAACVGPVCAEALREEGVTDVVWPDPNRLPAMVRQVEALLT